MIYMHEIAYEKNVLEKKKKLTTNVELMMGM